MLINYLYIQNFKGFEQKEISFNPGFTVVIGDNSLGKSSLLHALQVALGAYLQCLPIPASAVYRRQFRQQEVFVKWNDADRGYSANEQETLIRVFSQFNNDQIEWSRVMLANGMTSHSRKHVGELMDAVSGLLKERKQTSGAVLPVVASFGTERTMAQQRKGKRAQERRSRMEKGYLAALSDKVDFEGVIEWLYNYDNELKYDREFAGTKEAVFEAIAIAIPYLEDIGFNTHYRELEAVVKIDDKDFGRKTHSNMSDGLIAMLNLVAELAFRCVILNGYLGSDAVIQTKGVVLIDELDMHLHPNWQRHVIRDLKQAFPNIQFIVTTHSAFIVQSIRSEELIIIDDEIQKGSDPFRKTIEAVAAEEMGVENVPRSIEFLKMQEVAQEYFELIQAGKTSDNDERVSQLREQLNELEERFGEDPAFVASLKIERKAKGL
ncbi:AAA family ATPase [Chitinophaga ginsengisoli]|uniref:Putative ATP-binding protein involved in virulence n=1 Tax=Chitinophaga ginsengisoli TaxID=363837 RepID=A0A2P8GPW8_9BACT|nr:AAA family ATPase [Chitinophaga ginsengisoli]PSL36008.1 putative ATP-binding protein involved in virulence [Chitinophaga ginsengisoli]